MGDNSWIFLVVIIVMFGGMMALSIIPQKKRQKQYTEMQSQIRVGTKIMTIGRIIGVVTKMHSDNTLELNVGTEGKPVIIVINREAIGINLDVQQAGKAAVETKQEVDELPKFDSKEADITEVGTVIETKEGEGEDSI